MMMAMKGYGGKGGGWGCGGGGQKKNEKEKKVKVKNIPPQVTWQELKEHMQKAGNVAFCNVKNGEGEVRYDTEAEAQNAMSTLNGSTFAGASLEVIVWA